MATATAPRVPAEPTTPQPLRLSGADLRALVEASREGAAQRRQDYLAAHPDYIPCVVAACTGLVSPAFVRTNVDGRRYGWCPRRRFHAQVEAEAFAI
jgi:hypothetical protein